MVVLLMVLTRDVVRWSCGCRCSEADVWKREIEEVGFSGGVGRAKVVVQETHKRGALRPRQPEGGWRLSFCESLVLSELSFACSTNRVNSSC